MRSTTAAAGVLVTAVLSLGFADPANAAPDRDCPDFASQADAQAAFDAVPGDPERLDADDDGIACEDQQYAAAPATSDQSATAPSSAASTDGSQVSTQPVGAVAAGDGSASEDSNALPYVLGGATLAAAGGAAVAARRSARASA